MKCVVCGAVIAEGNDRYANAWEAVRRKLPCCSEACCRAFDPDRHWLAARPPRPVHPAQEERLLALGAARLRYGDEPSLIARELLLSGVSPDGLRNLLLDVQRARGRGLGSWLRVPRESERIATALAHGDRWDRLNDRPPSYSDGPTPS